MREEFIKRGVTFVSCGEDFDTSTPMGKLMVNIMMMFAELERETIQKRITDNYYARGEKGLYLGGYAPFGYRKVATHVNGIKTCMFEENAEESGIVTQMYTKYASGESLDEIAVWLDGNGILTRQKKQWSSTTVARLLRNPVYVRANEAVYDYLVGLGATMNNDVSEYTGESGCYVYGKAKGRTRLKFTELSNDFVTLGLHKGIVGASLWLGVQQELVEKKTNKSVSRGSVSWLQGLIRCGCGCSYHAKTSKSKAKEYKYLYCPGKKETAYLCPAAMLPMVTFEKIVAYIIIFHAFRLYEDMQHSDVMSHHMQSFKEIEDTLAKKYTLVFRNEVSRDALAEEYETILKWHSLDTDMKRKICRKIIKKIVVECETIHVEYR